MVDKTHPARIPDGRAFLVPKRYTAAGASKLALQPETIETKKPFGLTPVYIKLTPAR